MPNRMLPALVLLLLSLLTSFAAAQQDHSPVGPDHKPGPSRPQPDAVLTISCDMPCRWFLDGVAINVVREGEQDKHYVKPGMHALSARSLDGLDQVSTDHVFVSDEKATLVWTLIPVRDARLKSEKEASDKAAGELLRTKAEAEIKAHQAVTFYGEKNYDQAGPLAVESCNAGIMVGCRVLGLLYIHGKTVPQNYARARALFTQACNAEAGDASACDDLGWMDMNQFDLPPDYAAARTLTSGACDAGDMRGCTDFGVLLEQGLGGEKDSPRAMAKYAKSCNGGNMDGCAYQGSALASGLAGSSDIVQARPVLDKACAGGSDFGCSWLAIVMEVSGDYTGGRANFEKACKSEEAFGCVGAAQDAAFGRGGPRDLDRARGEFRKSCDDGNMFGCAGLGESYSVDARQDLKQGLDLLRQSCRNESSYGCFDLALDYERGYGTDADFSLAREQLGKACNQSDESACKEAAILHARSVLSEPLSQQAYDIYLDQCGELNLLACESLVSLPGVKSLPQAQGSRGVYFAVVKVFEDSCNAGNPRGCAAMGELFDNGLLDRRDVKTARFYFQKACNAGLSSACLRAK